MDIQAMRSLKRGDIVRNKKTGIAYTVAGTLTLGSRITGDIPFFAIVINRTEIIANPTDWEVIAASLDLTDLDLLKEKDKA